MRQQRRTGQADTEKGRGWIRYVVPLAAAILVCSTSIAAAQQPGATDSPPTVPGGLDQQLLDNLRPARPPERSPSSGATIPAGEDVGQGPRANSLLSDIERRMRHVETLLRGRDTSASTRELQDAIARDLARLIEEAPRSRDSSNSRQPAESQPSRGEPGENPAGEPSSSDPGGAAARRVRPGGPAIDEPARRAAQAVWGNLPDRVRQQIQQFGQEEYLPEFANVIRDYYQRLAERVSQQP